MTILERLRQLFERPGVPEEARRVYSESKSTGELVRGLEELWGRNRLEYDERYDELAQIGRLVASQRDQLRADGLDDIAKDRLMDDLELRLPQLAFLKSRVRMLKGNMQVQQNLIGKIQEMETMSLRGFNQAEVDAILERVQDELAEYVRDIKAGESSEQPAMAVDADAEAAEREARRRKLLGEPETKAGARGTVRESSGRKPETE